METKKYTIQGKEFTSKDFENFMSVEDYRDAKLFISFYESYLKVNTENELEEVFKYSEDFMNLTDGLSYEEFAIEGKDKKGLDKINKTIQKNISKFPNALKSIDALTKYQSILEALKESFLLENSIIKNRGIDSMINNLSLLFRAFLINGTQINVKTKKTDETLELIRVGKDVLADFFLTMIELKKSFQVSPLTLRSLNLPMTSESQQSQI